MDVEKLTLSQWLSVLKLSHLYLLGGFMFAVGVAGYFFGSWNLEVSISNATAELRERNSELLKINADWVTEGKSWGEKYNELKDLNDRWEVHAEKLQGLLSLERSNVKALQDREDELNSCMFTQEQIENIIDEIKAKKDQIDNYPSRYAATNPLYIAGLESRLSGFQKSLQSCNFQGL